MPRLAPLKETGQDDNNFACERQRNARQVTGYRQLGASTPKPAQKWDPWKSLNRVEEWVKGASGSTAVARPGRVGTGITPRLDQMWSGRLRLSYVDPRSNYGPYASTVAPLQGYSSSALRTSARSVGYRHSTR
jgi:hypothetical protein